MNMNKYHTICHSPHNNFLHLLLVESYRYTDHHLIQSSVYLLWEHVMYRISMLGCVVWLPCTSALMSPTELCKVKNAFKRGSTGFMCKHIIHISSTISPSITAGQRSVIHLQSDLFIFPSISRWNRRTRVHYRHGHVMVLWYTPALSPSPDSENSFLFFGPSALVKILHSNFVRREVKGCGLTPGCLLTNN